MDARRQAHGHAAGHTHGRYGRNHESREGMDRHNERPNVHFNQSKEMNFSGFEDALSKSEDNALIA